MMSVILQGKLRAGKDLHSPLEELTASDGTVIGGAFAGSLATTLTGDAAVDEWMVRFRAVKEFEERVSEFREKGWLGNELTFTSLSPVLSSFQAPWFRPMMDTISLKLLEVSGSESQSEELKSRVFNH